MFLAGRAGHRYLPGEKIAIDNLSTYPNQSEEPKRSETAPRLRPLSRGREFTPELSVIQEVSAAEEKQAEEEEEAANAEGGQELGYEEDIKVENKKLDEANEMSSKAMRAAPGVSFVEHSLKGNCNSCAPLILKRNISDSGTRTS
ncbi:unnamed protein product [Dibothriocephalus latus]|uniref:Uncharacterized protein n=1 Tax=Dibothriocephalus latus TaxID=60516 RepID=A0A3P6QMU3_DIBLA|nr:unnamed protein product [Dibothriocephalus latus]